MIDSHITCKIPAWLKEKDALQKYMTKVFKQRVKQQKIRSSVRLIMDFLSKIDQAVANESKDVAMETKGQSRGNQVFDMLRARLPQEITDDVVQLISYDKTAFADFASIKNQEDVTSFNEKYGTQLVIDVATV